MKKTHYAWVICGACTLLMFCTVGLAATAFSVYQPFLVSENGFTDSQASMIVTIRSVASVIILSFTDRIINALGGKASGGLSALFLAGGFLCFGLTQSFPAYCLGAALLGVSMGIGGMVLISLLIVRWFDDKQATALGICSAGSGIASIICPSIITMIIKTHSLRAAFLTEAFVILIAAVLLFLLIRDQPKDMHLQPYRSGNASPVKTKADIPRTETAASRPLNPTQKYLAIFCMLLLGIVGNIVVIYRASLYSSYEMDYMLTASLLSFGGAVLVPAKFLYGVMVDKLGGYRSNFLFINLLLAGIAILCFLTPLQEMFAFAGEALCGMGLPIITLGITIVATDFSDSASFTKILKNFQVTYQIGSIAASLLPGIIADLFGGYQPSFVICLLLLLLYEIVIQVLYRRRGNEW